MTPAKDLRMEQRRFAFVRDNGISTARCQPADIQSAINRALYQERVPHCVRVQEVRRNDRGTITGATIPTASAEMLLNYRDTVIRAARTQDAGIVGVELNEIWKRVKIHGIPLARYVGKGTHGTEKLREEIEAENEGVTIPLAVIWLGKLADIKARAMRGEISASSITFVVRGEGVANRLIKNGLRIIGKIYQVEAYEEARPDAMCGTCCGWGHVEAQCAPAKKPKCALCAEEHRTEHHKCPVEGCIATRGVACVHAIAKCPNCRGPHGARSSQCPRKKEAQEAARGWRGRATVLPPPPPPPSPATAPPPSSSPGTPDSETPETTQLATAEGDEDQDMGEDRKSVV